MKKALLALFCIFMFGEIFSQTEFETHKNGLIYPDATMSKLGKIVDSLNLKFKTCELNKVFYANSQTIGHIITLENTDCKEARKDLDNNISFEDFIKKYPAAKVKKEVLLLKFKFEDYNEKEIISFSEIELNDGYGLKIQRPYKDNLYNKAVKNTWLYDYYKKTSYSKESVTAFYFPENFSSIPIHDNYAKLIGYADCLIDTTSTKLLKEAKQGWFKTPENWQNLSDKKKANLLKELRSKIVIGGCSMDDSPRIHAMYIALLSAETTNWEVFLKSHLDIMNDRFERVSDGSYAYGRRRTYIKELEELNINVVNLLLGISLRMENPTKNHYYGNISRLGRAITESKDKKVFEEAILAMIEDNNLDDYNRVSAYFLYLSYNNHLEDQTEQQNNLDKVSKAVAKLPDYLKTKIKIKDIKTR
jgi:hypothetical protein